MRGYVLNIQGKRGHFFAGVIAVYAFLRRWLTFEARTTSTRGFRSNRAWYKATTAIRADVVQNCFDALRTEGTFVATDARVNSIGRQVYVTAFTIGS